MKTLAREVANTKPVVAHSEMPLLEAASILATKGYSGLPVVDTDRRVVGIVTEYDFLIHGTNMHLPTLIKVLNDLDLYRKDSTLVSDEMKKIINMKVGEVMNREPLTILDDTTLDAAAKIFAEHHRVNPLLIVDAGNKLVGILTRHDLIKLIGGFSLEYRPRQETREVDTNVTAFLGSFEKRFIVVSRFRTKTWLLFSALFFVIGFVVSFAFIVRINLR